MNSTNFYKTLISLDEIEREQKINDFSKENKITKATITKGLKAYEQNLKKEKYKAKMQEDNKFFRELFKLENVSLPENYVLKDGYICFSDEKTILYLTKIFAITQRIYTKNNTFWILQKANKKTEIIDSREFTKSDKIAMHFADRGEVLSPQKLQKVAHFISEFLRLNEHNITHRRGLLKTGWESEEYCLPSSDKYLFLNEELKNRFEKKGTLQNQIEMLNELGKGKAFILSLFSLASTFQGILNLPLNYICHVGGLTGEGKSFAVKTAVSLFGKKEAHAYGKNWNATLNGLEVYFEQMQDVPAWVDELESAKNLQEAVGALYIYSEGTGKARAYIDGFGAIKERDTKNFRGHLFTTGEKSLWDVIQKVGQSKNRPLGLVRRSLDLDSVELWKNINKKKVGELLDSNNGLFVDFFIDCIKKENIQEQYRAIENKYKLSLDGKENLFYILILTLDILRKYNVIDETIYTNQMNYIYDEISNSSRALELVQNSHNLFLEELNNYVALNKNKIVDLVDEAYLTSIIGRYEEQKNMLTISTTVVNELCEKHGFVKKQILTKLAKEKKLVSTKSKQIRIHGTKPSCYQFILYEDEKNKLEIVYETMQDEEKVEAEEVF